MKFYDTKKSENPGNVAPLAGAWIEIWRIIRCLEDLRPSLPSRERGLKYEDAEVEEVFVWSLPSRERGLKCMSMESVANLAVVAPLAGAWIEILPVWEWQRSLVVAPLAGAWIEIVCKGP